MGTTESNWPCYFAITSIVPPRYHYRRLCCHQMDYHLCIETLGNIFRLTVAWIDSNLLLLAFDSHHSFRDFSTTVYMITQNDNL